MGQNIEIPMQDGTLSAYLSQPAGSVRPVLVLHAWWGLNDFIRGLCDRLSAEGFTALAPDLFHGTVARTIPDAESLRDMLDSKQAANEMLAATDYLRQLGAPKLGMIGFSLGAYLGMGILDKRPTAFSAVVLFYGSRRAKIQKSRAAFQVHWAERDPYETPKGRQTLAANLMSAGLPASLYEYEGAGHWFFENDRPDAFHPASARLAWQRTLEFLNEHIPA